MTTQDLYDIAEQSNIDIIKIDCKNSGSISLMSDNGNCYIGIDSETSLINEKIMLAHELGHCQTGAFYNRYSNFNVVSKLEYKANKWAIKKLLPLEEMEEAMNNGYIEIWQLAEYFEVSETIIKEACYLYFNK